MDQGGELSAQTLLDAMEKVRNQRYTVCLGSDVHVVHPQARGWTSCANCGAMVDAGGTPNCVECKIATVPSGSDYVCLVCGTSMGSA